MPRKTTESRQGSHRKVTTNRELLIAIWKELHRMADNLAALTAQVRRNTDVSAAVVVLIRGLIVKITEAQDDPEQIAALVAELKASEDAMAAAVVEGTPADPAPEEPSDPA